MARKKFCLFSVQCASNYKLWLIWLICSPIISQLCICLLPLLLSIFTFLTLSRMTIWAHWIVYCKIMREAGQQSLNNATIVCHSAVGLCFTDSPDVVRELGLYTHVEPEVACKLSLKETWPGTLHFSLAKDNSWDD